MLSTTWSDVSHSHTRYILEQSWTLLRSASLQEISITHCGIGTIILVVIPLEMMWVLKNCNMKVIPLVSKCLQQPQQVTAIKTPRWIEWIDERSLSGDCHTSPANPAWLHVFFLNTLAKPVVLLLQKKQKPVSSLFSNWIDAKSFACKAKPERTNLSAGLTNDVWSKEA